MTKRDKRVAEKRRKAAEFRQRMRQRAKVSREAERSGYTPPKPDPGTPCVTCREAEIELGISDTEEMPTSMAETFWLATDQNPDYEQRLYRMDPVCIFHAKFWHALYDRWNTPLKPEGERDLYGFPDRTPDPTLTLDGLVALMTESLNSELDAVVETRRGRKRRALVQFEDSDMIRHSLQWTRNDMLIMGAWAQVLSTMMEQGSYQAGGPEDVVPGGRSQQGGGS